jgi:hypothetical protein
MTQDRNLNIPASDPDKSSAHRLAETLERHRAFWMRLEVDRPLLRVAPWQDWQPYSPFILRNGSVPTGTFEIKPGLLDPLATLLSTCPRQEIDGDMICSWGPYDQCWTEAILGCRVLRAGPSVWSESFITQWEQVDSLPPTGSQAWLDELLTVNRVLVNQVANRHPVAQPLMRGPLDMAEAALPSEMLYEGFYEQPQRLLKFLELCASLFIQAAQRRLTETPRFHGGYAVRSEWGLWAPGSTVQFQADASRNLSAKTYREFLFEIDRSIASQFDYPIIHTHSGSRHILPVLVEEPELKAIEITLDPAPYGPSPLELLPSFRIVQQAGKALYISGPMKRSELDIILETLSPVGLAIRAGLLPE